MNRETERVEVLLALADAFAAGGAAGGAAPASEAREALLSTFDPDTRHAVRRRGEWLDRLTPDERHDWLRHTLSRARPLTRAAPPLDEHLHHSHVAEALRGEPERVRRLVVAHLPPALAAACADALGLADEVPRGDPQRRGGPEPEVVRVVRRVFLSHFITLADVERPTAVDSLSGAELARLVRLLGVRETALACRGIEAVEAVAAFLKRFAPEDARAVAAHLRTLTGVEPWRVARAGQHVQEALRAEPDPGAMLDRTGLRLLATALSGRARRASLRYAAQKLPVEAARWLRLMAATGAAADASPTGPTGTPGAGEATEGAEARRLVAREVEEVAAGLRRRRN